MRSVAGLLLLAVAPGFAAEAGKVAASLPVFFIEDSSARYLVQTPQMRAVFTADGAEFGSGDGEVRVRFAEAGPGRRIQGTGPMGRANFWIGQDRSQWRTGLPTFRQVLYRNLYPGIDLVYTGADGHLKSEFRVAPGANPAQIRIEYSENLSVDSRGCLHAGQLVEEAPEVYQITAAGRKLVRGRYRLLDRKTAGFELSPYDPSLPLVIDPVLSYSTYLGGTGMGAVTGVAVDGGGNLYATGWTEALDFPINGPVQAANQGSVDAFVVKFNSSGSALLYATYIGGQSDDRGASIALDSIGQAYVTGSTTSTNFPVVNAIRPAKSGSRTAFALKLNSTGNTLVYSTYLGGKSYEVGTAVAVDGSGNAYFAGDTQSANFPVLNAAQAAIGGGMDAYITKLTPVGALSFSTFLGGSANEHAGGIAVDSSGNVYLAGGTYSTNFPVLGAIQSINGGSQDAFVTKLASTGSQFLYSTYLGGSGASTPEQANGIVVDSNGNAYVTGVTNSTNFPVTAGAYQAFFGGVSDAFVAKINAAGNGLVYSTYLGGTSFDWSSGIGIDSSGSAYVTGYTSSEDFASVSGVQAGFGGYYDAFVSEISAAGNALSFSTYLGGSASDAAYAVAVDGSGNMFVGGQTSSLNFPLAGPIQSSNNGGSIGWVSRIGVTAPPAQLPSVVSVSPSSGSGNTVTFTAQYSDSGGASALASVSLLVNTSASGDYACYVSYNPATNQFALANDVASTGSQTVIPGGGSQQNSQCTLNGAGSSASLAGSTLTLTVSLAFQPGFAGTKAVYLSAADAGAATGFVSRGAWTVTVPPPQPSADSVSPNAGTGSSQTFTFVFSDTQNAGNITAAAMLFAGSITTANACYLVYDQTRGTVALLSDNGLSSGSKPIASTTVLQNSQCMVGATSAQIAGLSVIVNVAITFKAAFNGLQNIYLYASEAASNTGWVQRGTFTVSAGGVPVANSAVPNSGSGAGQRFSFTISDQGGSGFLTDLAVLIAPALNASNACSLLYDRLANTVSLAYDTPTNGASTLVPGSNAVISNSQCSLNGANTTVVYTATSMIVTLDLAFNAAYFGAKNIYLYAAETNGNSGWVTVGSWTVTGGSPTADSVNPSSGSGSSSYFTFTVSDSVSQQNLTGMSMLLTAGAPTALTGACYLVYDRNAATIGLYDDTATTLSTKGIGSSAALQNSQCAVGYTVMVTSGNSVSFTIQLVFKAAFTGAKTVYLQANEPTTNSGWVQRGTWTVQ